jgi:hypothetical protein
MEGREGSFSNSQINDISIMNVLLKIVSARPSIDGYTPSTWNPAEGWIYPINLEMLCFQHLEVIINSGSVVKTNELTNSQIWDRTQLYKPDCSLLKDTSVRVPYIYILNCPFLNMRIISNPLKESFCSNGIAPVKQIKINRITSFINGTIEVFLFTFYLDVGVSRPKHFSFSPSYGTGSRYCGLVTYNYYKKNVISK